MKLAVILLFVATSLILFLGRILLADHKTAIVVLGGGLTSDGNVPYHTRLRIQRAAQLHKELGKSAFIITLSGGTPHKPNPLDSSGFPIWEATAAAKALIEEGVSPECILEEAFSLDTIGNAYFLRTVHIVPGRFTKMIVITNKWHMDRTRVMFNKVFGLPDVNGLWQVSNSVSIEYSEVDDGLSGSALESRLKREKASVDAFVTHTQHHFSTMQQLHLWLFTKHSAYASSRLLVTR